MTTIQSKLAKGNSNEQSQEPTHITALSTHHLTRPPDWITVWRDRAPNGLLVDAAPATRRALPISQPGDRHEREADRAADRVMHMPESAAQRVSTGAGLDQGPNGLLQPQRSGEGVPAGQAAPPIVHEALRSPGQPLYAGTRAFMESRLGQDFSGVRVHTDGTSARSAQAIGARAYTVGQDLVFAPGAYAPDTGEGQRVLAHELTHVMQQRATGAAVQRQSVVNMLPETIRSSLRGVEQTIPNLGSLRGAGRGPDEPTIEHDPADVQRNAPDPARLLPFRGAGWDADAIMASLGQYDTLPGTDSDALRCVQAVALAARIPQGPAAVVAFLRSIILEGMLSRPRGPRQRTAIVVIEHVIARIETQRATFGDLLWVQEAMHDLFYNDVSGTPKTDIPTQMNPAFDFSARLQPMNVWCDNPADVIAAANRLQPGEQLLVNTWQVSFNTAFDQVAEQGTDVPVGGSITASVNGRAVRIRRIAMDRRPPHTAIDPVRDSQAGHQLLVLKDGATGQLRLYEPEITASGRHLETLNPDGSNFQRYFTDQPRFGIYNYIQILGKLTPDSLTIAPPARP